MLLLLYLESLISFYIIIVIVILAIIITIITNILLFFIFLLLLYFSQLFFINLLLIHVHMPLWNILYFVSSICSALLQQQSVGFQERMLVYLSLSHFVILLFIDKDLHWNFHLLLLFLSYSSSGLLIFCVISVLYYQLAYSRPYILLGVLVVGLDLGCRIKL